MKEVIEIIEVRQMMRDGYEVDWGYAHAYVYAQVIKEIPIETIRTVDKIVPQIVERVVIKEVEVPPRSLAS